MPRKGEEEGWPAKGAKRKKGRARTVRLAGVRRLCFVSKSDLDDRQITHLICARLKYDLYDFFRGCFWAFIQEKERKQAQNTP